MSGWRLPRELVVASAFVSRPPRLGDCVPAIVSWAGPRPLPPVHRATGQVLARRGLGLDQGGGGIGTARRIRARPATRPRAEATADGKPSPGTRVARDRGAPGLPVTASALSECTRVTPTAWVLGIEARTRALLSDGPAADGFYRESVERLGQTRVRAELARSHLLYGEWLRRERRRAEAREQLRTAHRMLEEMGMEAFAERARRELRATGETARTRTVPAARAAGAGAALTPQEAQVARLAREGLSNPEIGARLFISPRTAQYHLSNVFTKLGITSRSQLDRALPADRDTAGPR